MILRQTYLENVVKPVNQILERPSVAGLVLIGVTVVALAWANSSWHESYFAFWEATFTFGSENFGISQTMHHWVNDGLMTIFFFFIGLEVKREAISGTLSTWKKASLPITAALVGMVIPIVIYRLINANSTAINGWGIPMVTDTAFALALLSFLGRRVPSTLKFFLLALAVVDDIGGIVIVAFFYTPTIDYVELGYSTISLGILAAGSIIGIRNTAFYLIVGTFGLWTALLLSGVHATLAGVLAAMTIPAKKMINENEFSQNLGSLQMQFEQACKNKTPFLTEDQQAIINKIKRAGKDAEIPLQSLQNYLRPIISYIVVPVFILANAGVIIERGLLSDVTHPVSLGIAFGLVFGKLLGIGITAKLMVHFGISKLPNGMTLHHVYGAALLAGVGFTMSLFISDLALGGSEREYAKLGILFGSVVSGIGGMVWLTMISKR